MTEQRMTEQRPRHGVLQRSKKAVFAMLLLFWLFCLPLAFAIYTPHLYQANCHWNERCEHMGMAATEQRITELTAFFLHATKILPHPWTVKESIHMEEVRQMYDYIFVAFILVTLLFLIDLILFKQGCKRYTRYARTAVLISCGLLVIALIIAPFFNTFWMKVFHPLLFDNDLWRTNSQDISWYLMPKSFFLRVTVFICVMTVVLNGVVWLGGRRWCRTDQSDGGIE